MPETEATSGAATLRPDGQGACGAEALHLSAGRLADIIDFLPDATMVVGRGGTVIAWNRAMEDLTGCPAGDMIGRGGRVYAVPFYGERRPMLVDAALGAPDAEALYPELERDGDTVMADIVMRQPDGGVTYQWAKARPLRDAEGVVVGAVEAVRDVTDRKRAEERYRVLFESSRDALMTLAPPSWRFTSGNPAALAMFGVKDEAQFTLLGPWDVSPEYQPDGRPSTEKAREMLETTVRDGSSFFEWTHRRPGGGDFPATVLLTCVEVGGQTIIQATVRDITDRKRMEHELRRLAMIAEQAAEGIAWADLEGNLEFVNEAWARMHGYGSAEELVGRNLSMFHTDEQMKTDVVPFNEVVKQQGHNAGEVGHARKDGTTFPTQMTVALLKDEQGKPYGLAGFAEDITDRKRAEAALADQKAALERSNAELQEFAYVASHDLQEPLRMVASYVQLLEQRYGDALDDDAREFIAFAVDGARRMQALINDLLTYSRVGTCAKPFAAVDGETVLNAVLADLEVAIRETGAEVTHDPLPRVVGDEAQLGRVFQNLIGNALKFCEGAPRVHVSAQRGAGAWRFAVRDNGIGIERDQRDRIFVIFQRLNRREAYPGTGMGLAITKKIVERHGGRVWVEDAPGGGSIFLFTIPDRKEPADAPRDPDEAGDVDTGAGPAGRNPARGGQPRRHPAHARGAARG